MKAVMIVLICVVCSGAQAEDINSTQAVSPGCKNFMAHIRPTNVAEALAQGRCVGLVEALQFAGQYLPGQMKNCAYSVTTGEAIQAVLEFPESLRNGNKDNFKVTVLSALSYKYRCK